MPCDIAVFHPAVGESVLFQMLCAKEPALNNATEHDRIVTESQGCQCRGDPCVRPNRQCSMLLALATSNVEKDGSSTRS